MMDVLRTVFPSDPEILKDIHNLRQIDSHKILRRLDSLHQHYEPNKVKSLGDDAIKGLIDVLVGSYMGCSESIKVSRAIELLWKPLLPMYQTYIETAMEDHIMKVTREKLTNLQNVSRFSVLLEQNTMVQDIVKRNVCAVVCWVSEELPPLLHQPASFLSVSKCQCVYALVKVILQLFQVSPQQLGLVIWGDLQADSQSLQPFQKAVQRILTSLLHILCQPGYQTDCVLLGGTATALMLNSSPNPLSVQEAFYHILQSTLNKDVTVDSDVLPLTAGYTSINCDRLSSLNENNIGTVALIRGVVACCNNDSLFTSQTEQPAMIVTLFTYITQLCQGNITLHYHTFTILLLWYSRISKTTYWTENPALTNQMRSLIQPTIDIVTFHWDSPIEDVPETVVNIFDQMMSVWSMMKDKLSDLPQNVLKTLLTTAWFVKGKYRILAVMLKYLDNRKLLDEFPDIRSQLLQCMTTNHLYSTASNVYKAFLTQLQKVSKEDLNAAWRSLWMDTVIQGLVSENSLLQYNTSTYWIPMSLKLVPHSGIMLQDHLTVLMQGSNISYTRLLHAWTVINKTIRLITGKADLSNNHVREALHHLDEGVRSEAISLICNSLKKTEPVSRTEIVLLQEVFTYNIKIDSAPFRQHLATGLRNVLTRIRDSSITLLKSPDKHTEPLERCVDFIDWLHKVCMDCLLPGSNYQRRKGSLDLLQVIYDCLICRLDEKHRKGFTPDAAKQLVEHALKNGKWQFFCKGNAHTLIVCLMDGASEIQTAAFNLLTKYYDFDSLYDNATLEHTCCHLLREALRLCNSPKGHESESGAILCKLLYQKLVVSKCMFCTFTYDGDDASYRVISHRRETSDKLGFIHSLLDEAKRQMELSNQNLVKASKQFPIHGLILAITRCVTETDDLLQIVSETDTVNILSELILFCDMVIHNMLNIMSSVAGQEACPSFAEIGIALETLLHENQTDYRESTAQSPEFQYMLAWCWNNINECCSCLGDVTLAVVLNKIPLSLTVIEQISSTYISVLTKCRHKGVIEGCRSAFVKFCSALISSDQEQYHDLPANILAEVLTSLKTKVMSSSVTRRSAGLPIIVQAVLVSEKKIKKTVLLKSCVAALFEIGQLPLEVDLGLTDLPQVHGLNILNSLFADATLGVKLTGHISEAVVMVIKEFGSPSWAMRNAATRLFSTLIKRIFGQKKTSDVSLCNTVTFQELSSYYPELPPFMLTVLNEASNRDICDISQIHPGLFPVLTLLSCLHPMDTKSQTIQRELQVFRKTTQPFLASPVYQLRHLVASSLVSMVNMADMMAGVEAMLDQTMSQQPTNQLHGNFLFSLQLLDHLIRPDDLNRLGSLVLGLHPILDCAPILSSTYIQLLTCLVKKQPSLSLPQDLLIKIEMYCCSDEKQDIGAGIFIEQSVNFLFLCNQSTNNLCSLFKRLLASNNLDTRKACIDHMAVEIGNKPIENKLWKQPVLRILCSSLKCETSIPNLCSFLHLITSLFIDHMSMEDDSVCQLRDWFQNNSQWSCQYVSLKAAMLPVYGIVIQQNIRGNQPLENLSAVSVWCDDLLTNATVTNETQRLAVTQALLIAGQHILNWALINQTDISTMAAVSLLKCCLILVQDEDTEIRQEACKFIASLQFKTNNALYKYDSLHSNMCYELLLEYAVRQYPSSTRCIEFLLDQLYTQGQLVKVIKEKKTARFDQLFDQEDNSFYAEKIYNAFSVHRCLKTAMFHKVDDTIAACLEGYSQAVCTDMDILVNFLQLCDKDCVINECSDNMTLCSLCSVLLMCDLVNQPELRDKLGAAIQMNALPQNIQHQAMAALQTETSSLL